MTKISIKIISVIMCAVMVVGCCFVGCEEKPQYKEVTKQEVYEAFKAEYPDAEIVGEDHKLYLKPDSEYPYVGNYWLDLNSTATPIGFSLDATTSDDTKKMINILMGVFYDWTNADFEALLEHFTIENDEVCQNKNGSFKYKDISIDVSKLESMDEITVFIY